MDIKIEKIKAPSKLPGNKMKKRRVSGVNSTIYKPFQDPLSSLDLPKALTPLLSDLDPTPGYLRIWPDEDEDIPLSVCKFGVVPKGSVLAYQQPLVTVIATDYSAPWFDFPVLHYPATVLTERQQVFFQSFAITPEQSEQFEKQTRDQSSCNDWHRLRKNRLTATTFKRVCSRKKDFVNLSEQLVKTKFYQSTSMKYGVEHEDEAAQYYSEQSRNTCYKVGFIINPSLSHLGCSPDRRVHDPTENSAWGLLEIKCSMADRLSNLKYLKFNARTAKYSLRQSHQYYYQVMACLGLTGCTWGDFFVFCKQEFHLERIYFDTDIFSEMLEKVNMFYFNYHLPYLTQ